MLGETNNDSPFPITSICCKYLWFYFEHYSSRKVT